MSYSTMTRPTEAGILMATAELWATRSTCSRLHVGAVISKSGRIVSSGYNGNAASLEHCVHTDDSPCTTAAHAEENAIVFAARDLTGCTMWCTHAPCYTCSRMIINAGISDVVYELDYRSTGGVDLLKQANINVRKYSDIS